MAMKDPNTSAQKWATNLSGAGTTITNGVNAVTVAPGTLAAAQKAAYVQNTAASADKFAANSQKVTLNEWQQATINKGVPRIAAGAQAAEPKMAAFLTKALPVINSIVKALPPRGSLQQNLQRSNQFCTQMSQQSFK